jgi:hypothetical protein
VGGAGEAEGYRQARPALTVVHCNHPHRAIQSTAGGNTHTATQTPLLGIRYALHHTRMALRK